MIKRYIDEVAWVISKKDLCDVADCRYTWHDLIAKKYKKLALDRLCFVYKNKIAQPVAQQIVIDAAAQRNWGAIWKTTAAHSTGDGMALIYGNYWLPISAVAMEGEPPRFNVFDPREEKNYITHVAMNYVASDKEFYEALTYDLLPKACEVMVGMVDHFTEDVQLECPPEVWFQIVSPKRSMFILRKVKDEQRHKFDKRAKTMIDSLDMIVGNLATINEKPMAIDLSVNAVMRGIDEGRIDGVATFSQACLAAR